ncbi:spindle and kinetochore-associated protein 1-like [Planococcus citri]|uniref:spindle and kinetochore-associated protein 1-like n=1 Tax=Planococcus citri TaxID=170843 RepID=UPI0031F940CB
MDISFVLTQVEDLSDALAILEGQYNDPDDEIEDKCMDLFTNLGAVKESMDALRNVFAKIKEQHQISLEKISELENLQKRSCYIRNNCPKVLNSTHVENNKTFCSSINDTATTQNTISPIPSSWSHLETPVAKSNSSSDKTKQEIQSVKCRSIAHVTEEEFDSVPKYMKGRLNVGALNKLIDCFNTVFKKKYDTVRQAKKTVKSKDMEYYCDWKREENTEPKGTFFITGKDLTTFGDTKLDKGMLNMITILRHLKRVKESRQVNGPVHYVLL